MKFSIDFLKGKGLVPAIIQDYQTGDVYMLGYMNEESLQKTLETGWVYFYSRSRQKLWMKGEESGNKLKVKEIYSDCDNDSILVKVELIGTNVCHVGNKSCFYDKLESNI
ncbi:MAG: phosphoribosyl-AMP cyclohydrolase [Candidatus Levybacteria bacterium RIFCSPHIGHO2_01_FULL_36_15]|nr:MAG: phosphoribosyl-AMP cyclohydrolase [Candidatus Levybacteria bacterium RIFCSPHIGHO2_01_FULL_36_15]OGH38055.1 MAG: phosphoribosyl-AMP cyclohydrolase [Candidatus Levybacteria bacterium RIFCSPLOWO2_01_FULL_36_10]